MDFFRNFFNVKDESFSEDPRHYWKESDQRHDHQGLDVFSDPVRMQQFFENEINGLLKSFGFGGFSGGDIFSQGLPRQSCDDEIELRNHFLKDGFQKSNSKHTDEDLDSKIKNGKLESLWKDKPDQLHDNHRMFFSGQSHTFKTVTHPDGSIQTENVMRDSDGNEQRTVCHKLGIKEYCIIKRVNKDGIEEITENLVNIDENEKASFLK